MKVASLEIELLANIARLQTDMRNAQGVVERSMSNMRRSVESLRRAFAALGVGVGFGVLVREAAQLTDAYIGLQGQLKNATQNQAELSRAMADVRRIAATSQANIEGVATAYARFSNNLRDTGIQQQKIADITETVALALKVNGASVSETTSAMQQLSQAFGKGKLDGDEFRTMMEASPNVMRRVAEAIGVPFGALKDLAKQGQITATVLANALSDSSYLETLRSQAKEMYTIGGALTVLRNAVMEFVGTQAQASGVVSALTGGIMALANNVDVVARGLTVLAVTAIPLVIRGMMALTAVMLKNPFVLIAAGIVTVAQLLAPLIEQTGALGVAWDTLGALFESVGRIIGMVFDAAIEAAKKFLGLFDISADQIAAGLQDPIREAALFVADSFDAMAGVVAAFLRSVEVVGGNIVIVFVNAFNSVRQAASDALLDIVQWMNKTLGTNFVEWLWVGPGDQKLRSIGEEAAAAYSAGVKAFGMKESLSKSFAQQTLEGLNDAFDISLIDNNTTAVTKNATAVGKANSAYQNLIASIKAKIEQDQLEIATGDKATEADKLRIKVTQDLAAGRLKLSAAQRQVVDALLASMKASESELVIAKMRAAAQKQQIDLSAAAVKAAYDEARQNERLARQYGLTKVQIEQLTLADLQSQLARKDSLQLTDDQVIALEHLIEAHRRSIEALGQVDYLDKQKAAWESWQQSVQEIFQQVGQSLTDAIFDGGKSGLDLVKDLAKTLTLRLVIQPVMGALESAIVGVGPAGVANAAGTGSGVLGNLGGVGSLFTNFGGTAAGMVQNLGSSLAGFGPTSGLGANLIMQSDAIGSVLDTAGTILGYGKAIYDVTQGRYGSAIGTGLGTAIGGPVGGFIGGALGGVVDSLFSSAPSTRQGRSTIYDVRDGAATKIVDEDSQSPAFDNAIAQMTLAAAQGITNVFDALNIDAELTALHGRTDISQTGRGNGVASGGFLTIDGQRVDIGQRISSDDTKFGFGGWSDEAVLPRLQTDLQMTMLQAFQAVGDKIPDYIDGVLNGVDVRSLDATAVQGLVDQINASIAQVQSFTTALNDLPFENLHDLSLDAAAGLLQLAGGLENMQQLQSSYIDQFYSDAEKQALQIESIGKVLAGVGLEMPAISGSVDQMKAAWRALVDAQDINTEAGQRATVALLSVSGAFATVAGAAGSAAGAVQTIAQLFGAAQQTGQDALAAVQRSAQAQQAAINAQAQAQQQALQTAISATSKSVSDLTSLTGKLQSALNAMAGQINPEATFTWAQDRLDRALSVAKLTGQMPSGSDFDAALTAAQKPDPALFSSFEDFQAAQLRSANLISDLNDISGTQLSTDQKQLQSLQDQLDQSKAWQAAEIQRLDDILANAQAQLNSALGTNDAIMTLPEALKALAAAIAGLGNLAYFNANKDVADAFDRGAFGNLTADQAANQHYVEYGAGEGRTPPPNLSQGAEYMLNNPDVLNAYEQNNQGMSLDEFAKLHYNLYGKSEGRSYAVGTDYVPYDMRANIHQGEIIINRPDADILRRYGIGTQRTDAQEIRLLRQEVRELRTALQTQLGEVSRNTRRSADQQDQLVTNGMRVSVRGVVPTVVVEDRTVSQP